MNQAPPKPLADWVAYVEDVRNSAYEQGRSDGYREGYQRGIDEASDAAVGVVAGVADIIKSKVAEIINPTPAEEQPAPRNVRYQPRLADVEVIEWTGEETNREKILRALEHQAGMRPVEIIAWLERNGAKPNTNSISTTIKRMRGIDIEKRGEGWYIRSQVESAA
jgi:hypothetical protein